MRNVQMNNTNIVMSEGDLPNESLVKIRGAGIVGWDIETSGLDWRTEGIATCQLYSPGDTVRIVRVGPDTPENLSSILAEPSVKKVFHHAMFDLRFLHHNWKIVPENIACTKIASKLLDPAKEQAHSLQTLVLQHLEVALDKTEQRSDWLSTRLTERQLLYAAGDVLYLIPLLEKLEEALQAEGLLDLAHDCYRHIPTRVCLDVLGYEDIYTY